MSCSDPRGSCIRSPHPQLPEYRLELRKSWVCVFPEWLSGRVSECTLRCPSPLTHKETAQRSTLTCPELHSKSAAGMGFEIRLCSENFQTQGHRARVALDLCACLRLPGPGLGAGAALCVSSPHRLLPGKRWSFSFPRKVLGAGETRFPVWGAGSDIIRGCCQDGAAPRVWG